MPDGTLSNDTLMDAYELLRRAGASRRQPRYDLEGRRLPDGAPAHTDEELRAAEAAYMREQEQLRAERERERAERQLSDLFTSLGNYERGSVERADITHNIEQFMHMHRDDLVWDGLTFPCSSCGRTRSFNSYVSQEGVCSQCYDRMMGHRANVYDDDEVYRWINDDHTARPCLEYMGKPPYFGIELELEVTQRDSTTLAAAAKKTSQILRPDEFAILKHDGSLNCGFEICTRPADMISHQHRWSKFFAGKPDTLQVLPSCGLHIHTSRRGLSDLTIAKIVCFLNAYHNRGFIQVMAGRSANNYCQIKKKKLTTASEFAGDRYEAVNLANPNTIEFRIFRATLNPAIFFKALEFCDAIRSFCTPAARSLRESMMRSEFTHFVHKNNKQWPHLDAFIQAKWYGRETPLTKKFGFTPDK